MLENKKYRHFPCWYEAITAKYYGEGEVYGRPEFDKILGHYAVRTPIPLLAQELADLKNASQAVTDVPCVLFSDELIAAYPDAKVVLTNRDVERWIASVEGLYTVLDWRLMKFLAKVDPVRKGVPIYQTQHYRYRHENTNISLEGCQIR